MSDEVVHLSCTMLSVHTVLFYNGKNKMENNALLCLSLFKSISQIYHDSSWCIGVLLRPYTKIYAMSLLEGVKCWKCLVLSLNNISVSERLAENVYNVIVF